MLFCNTFEKLNKTFLVFTIVWWLGGKDVHWSVFPREDGNCEIVAMEDVDMNFGIVTDLVQYKYRCICLLGGLN